MIPGVLKYSALARKVTFRRTTSGMKNESQNDRWSLAMMAGPSSGTCSIPSTQGRHSRRSNGPRRTNFMSQ